MATGTRYSDTIHISKAVDNIMKAVENALNEQGYVKADYTGPERRKDNRPISTQPYVHNDGEGER